MNLSDGFVRANKRGRGAGLHNVHIGTYGHAGGSYFQHEEMRIRPLLVHKREAMRWSQQVDRAGMTIVPLKAYFDLKNRVKIEIALCKGKNVRDKRDTIKERDAKRESNRIIKNFRLG